MACRENDFMREVEISAEHREASFTLHASMQSSAMTVLRPLERGSQEECYA